MCEQFYCTLHFYSKFLYIYSVKFKVYIKYFCWYLWYSLQAPETSSEKTCSHVSGREKGQTDVSDERDEGSRGEWKRDPERRGLNNQAPFAFKAAAAAASVTHSITASVSTAITAVAATATTTSAATSAAAAAAAYWPRFPHCGHDPWTRRHRRWRQDIPQVCRHWARVWGKITLSLITHWLTLQDLTAEISIGKRI